MNVKKFSRLGFLFPYALCALDVGDSAVGINPRDLQSTAFCSPRQESNRRAAVKSRARRQETILQLEARIKAEGKGYWKKFNAQLTKRTAGIQAFAYLHDDENAQFVTLGHSQEDKMKRKQLINRAAARAYRERKYIRIMLLQQYAESKNTCA